MDRLKFTWQTIDRSCHIQGESDFKMLYKMRQRNGYSSLREKQEEIMKHFLSGRDTFVSLPTGSGKSLSVFDKLRRTSSSSIVVVVNPLMKDQVIAMNQSL